MNSLLCKILSFLCLASMSLGQSDPLKAFPPAQEGQVRHVIQVPKIEAEESAKVELIVGKIVETDGVNRTFFAGKIEEVELKGWGYSYYEVKQLGPMASTRIGIPQGQKPVEAFVRMNHDLPLLRYNSRMPIVVYLPAGVELRYRIWTAGKEEAAPQS